MKTAFGSPDQLGTQYLHTLLRCVKTALCPVETSQIRTPAQTTLEVTATPVFVQFILSGSCIESGSKR